MDFLTTHAGLINASARLTMAGYEHDFGTVATLPALVGVGFVVTRDGRGYMVETGGMGSPCATCADLVDELGRIRPG